MLGSIIKRVADWNFNRQVSAQEKKAAIARIITFSGSDLPGKTITVLGSVAAENGSNNPDDAREKIKMKAVALGANYIINYVEKHSALGLITCFGDAVLVSDP